MSKGSKPRPLSVSRQKFKENYDKIFKEKGDKPPKKNNNNILPRNK